MKRFLHQSWILLLSLLLWVSWVHAECQNNLPANNPDEVYVDHGDGTITDTRTDLMWKKCLEGLSGLSCQTGDLERVNWIDSLALANTSNFAGYTDWRLPNHKELASLVEYCRSSPAINTRLFPNMPISRVLSASPHNAGGRWFVHFIDGSDGNERNPGYIRLVRDTQSYLQNYTVTATAGSNGSISPSSRTVAHGSTTTFTVTAQQRLQHWERQRLRWQLKRQHLHHWRDY